MIPAPSASSPISSGKFLGPTGSGYTSGAVSALNYFTALKRSGINIVATSNSWGGGGYDSAMQNAIDAAGDQGMLFVAAAGNSAQNNDAIANYPSNYQCTKGGTRGWDCMIAVASITSTGALSSFSDWGATTVDLGAPGVNIYSTLPTNTYGSYSGTSMATPHVTGAVALLHAYRTDLTTYSARLNQLFGTVDPLSSLAGKTRTGGRLNLNRALTGTPAPLAQLTASPNSPRNVATISLVSRRLWNWPPPAVAIGARMSSS